jgi:rhodanese-related sulfurtransferase
VLSGQNKFWPYESCLFNLNATNMIRKFYFSQRARVYTISILAIGVAAIAWNASNSSIEANDQFAQIEVVGPSVLLNAREAGAVTILDLRSHGRRVPGAVPAANWRSSTKDSNPIFLLGDERAASDWARKRNLNALIIPSRMIEFHAMENVPQIAPRAAKRFVDESQMPLFDISEAPEFAASKLADSKRFDYADFRAGRWNQLPKTQPFIVACRVGHRSQLVVQELRRRGYDARNLDGGLWQWECDGLKVAR